MIINEKKLNTEITALIKKTGQELLQYFYLPEKNHLVYKTKHDIATQADLLAEKIILAKIKKLTPGWRIISEETGDNKIDSDYVWTIDPLDGTTNFYMGNPLFAVQIALLYKNEPVMSWIYAPAINEFYFSQKGKGAYLNSKRINVSKKNLRRALLTYCHGNKTAQIKQALKIYKNFKLKSFDIRQIGSAALEFAWVAKGRVEGYISVSSNLWDICPGVLLVQEAGGKIYDFKARLWTIKAANVLATNKVIAQPILKYLKTI